MGRTCGTKSINITFLNSINKTFLNSINNTFLNSINSTFLKNINTTNFNAVSQLRPYFPRERRPVSIALNKNEAVVPYQSEAQYFQTKIQGNSHSDISEP